MFAADITFFCVRYQSNSLSLQDLTDLFALFGLDRVHGTPAGTAATAAATTATGGGAVAAGTVNNNHHPHGAHTTLSAAERFILRDKDIRVVSESFSSGAEALAGVDEAETDAMKDNVPLAIDFGTLSLGEVRRVRLNITNPNPRDIRIIRISSNLPSVTIKVCGFCVVC